MNSAGRSSISSIFQHGLQDGYLSFNFHVKGGLFPLIGSLLCAEPHKLYKNKKETNKQNKTKQKLTGRKIRSAQNFRNLLNGRDEPASYVVKEIFPRWKMFSNIHELYAKMLRTFY